MSLADQEDEMYHMTAVEVSISFSLSFRRGSAERPSLIDWWLDEVFSLCKQSIIAYIAPPFFVDFLPNPNLSAVTQRPTPDYRKVNSRGLFTPVRPLYLLSTDHSDVRCCRLSFWIHRPKAPGHMLVVTAYKLIVNCPPSCWLGTPNSSEMNHLKVIE